MCFRPAGITMPEPECPECKKKLDATKDITECPFCSADLTEYAAEFKKKLAGMTPGGAGAPGVPAPPGAPGAPKPPGAPGAPKAPGA